MKVAIYSHSIAPSIDGVCRRYSAILHELSRQNHETLLFTMEEEPEDIPESTRTVFLDYMIFPSYPNKKVSRLTFRSLFAIIKHLSSFKPDVSSPSYIFLALFSFNNFSHFISPFYRFQQRQCGRFCTLSRMDSRKCSF